MELTEEQQAVVENRGGSLLVSAAAGAGKTRVLVDRLFRYVTEEHSNVDDFLIITFTRAAAEELRGRIAEELSRRIAERGGDPHLRRQLLRVYRADIKTVDAFCTNLLRENTHLLAEDGSPHVLTPDFRVLDEQDAELIKSRVLNRTMERFYEVLTPGKELLADTLGAGRDDRSLEALVLELHRKIQSHAHPSRWLSENVNFWDDLPDQFDATPYAEALLTSVRRRAGYWADVLEHAAEEIKGDSALFKGYGQQFLERAETLRELSGLSTWDAAARAASVELPRVLAPRGRSEEPAVAFCKRLWARCRESMKRLTGMLEVSGDEAMEDLKHVSGAMKALLELTEQFDENYRREKLRINAADFSDQEHLALRLLLNADGSPTQLGEQVSARYTEIMVDEYQDINEVQDNIFLAVSRNGGNLFMVGDVKQSIYRFRLADPTIFLGKYLTYREHTVAEDGQERKILLSKNFRSRREILAAANFIFSAIMSRELGEMEYGEDEALHFGAEYYPERTDIAVEFHLLAASSKSSGGISPVKPVQAEARFVAEKVRSLLDDRFPVTDGSGDLRPCRPDDFAILMRSPESRADIYSRALAEVGIPCSASVAPDFYDAMEISVVISILQVIDNPRQDVPLIAALRSPVFAFTPDRLAEIRALDTGSEYYDALLKDDHEDSLSFLKLLAEFREDALEMDVHGLLWEIYRRLNVLGVFGAMDDGDLRRENLITFTRQAENFEKNGHRGLFAFVSYLRGILDSGREPFPASSGGSSGVRILSVHRSKGLEFPIVILADLAHEFSDKDLRTPVLVHPEAGLGPVCVDLERKIKYPTMARRAVEERVRRESLSEEQRILYVAMTRAREKLIMTASVRDAERYLSNLAISAEIPVRSEAVAAGKSFADWILTCLLCREESTVLREVSEREIDILESAAEERWMVFLHDAEQFRRPSLRAAGMENGLCESSEPEIDPEILTYRYPYEAATRQPAKITATQLKGRLLDEEIAEGTSNGFGLRPLSVPSFMARSDGLTPAERGIAVHLVLQHLDLSNVSAAPQVASMRERGLLTQEQADSVDTEALDRLLSSELAEEIRHADRVLREYRFTILADNEGNPLDSNVEDAVLLQGVVDCCFETEEGITVVDFKTDRIVSDLELSERSEHYRPQVETYAKALERIMEKRVIRRVLYFTACGKTVDL